MGRRLEWLRVQQQDTCYLCGCCPMVEPSVDHVLPRGKGGNNQLHNVAAACKRCNNLRSSGPLGGPAQTRLRQFYRREHDVNGSFVCWSDNKPPPDFHEASWRWPGIANRQPHPATRTKRAQKRQAWRARIATRAAKPAVEIPQAPVDFDPWIHDLYE